METIRSTDYLATIPSVPVVVFVDAQMNPGTSRFSSALLADLALLALVFTAAIVMGLVILNWSR